MLGITNASSGSVIEVNSNASVTFSGDLVLTDATLVVNPNSVLIVASCPTFSNSTIVYKPPTSSTEGRVNSTIINNLPSGCNSDFDLRVDNENSDPICNVETQMYFPSISALRFI